MLGSSLKKVILKILYPLYLLILKISEWLQYEEFKKKHVSINLKNGQLKLVMVEHKDFAEEAQKRIRKYQKTHSPKQTIQYALKQALTGCNFIIFQDNDNENRFIQFWTSKGKLDHDFPMSESNGLHPYRLQITGYLANLGFVNDKVLSKYYQTFKGYKRKYWLDKTDNDLWTIKAKFNKEIGLARKYTHYSLKQILGVNLSKILIKIG